MDEIKSNSGIVKNDFEVEELGKVTIGEERELSDNVDLVVAQANEFVMMPRDPIKLTHQKILRLFFMQIRPGDCMLYRYKITAVKAAEILGVSVNNIYDELDELAEIATAKGVWVKNKDERKAKRYPYALEAGYENGVFEMVINPLLAPFLLGLTKDYFQYPMRYAVNVSKKYSIDILEMIISKVMLKNIPDRGVFVTLTLQELLSKFMLIGNKTYDGKVNNVTSRILEPALIDINSSTNYRIDYTKIKDNKTVTGFKIFVNDAKNKHLDYTEGVLYKKAMRFDERRKGEEVIDLDESQYKFVDVEKVDSSNSLILTGKGWVNGKRVSFVNRGGNLEIMDENGNTISVEAFTAVNRPVPVENDKTSKENGDKDAKSFIVADEKPRSQEEDFRRINEYLESAQGEK